MRRLDFRWLENYFDVFHYRKNKQFMNQSLEFRDDLTFSGHQKIPRSFLSELEAVLKVYGFKINPKKTRFSGPGQACYVTGLVVNEKVHPNREVRRKLRAMFHNAQTDPTRYRQRSSELLGWASFDSSLEFSIFDGGRLPQVWPSC